MVFFDNKFAEVTKKTIIEAKEMLNLKLISQEEFDKLKSKIIEE
jgi:predicted small metal-binding protein